MELKRILLIIWIISWTILGVKEIPTSLNSLLYSNNEKNWIPKGFVIVENRSDQKMMITEETDKKFNPKNTELCDTSFVSRVHSSIENNTLYLTYMDNPQFYGVNKMKLKMIPNGDWFRPDKGFKIHNFKTVELSNNLSHEIPLNIYKTVKDKYYIDFILEGFGKDENKIKLCFTEHLISINEDNFKNYIEITPFT